MDPGVTGGRTIRCADMLLASPFLQTQHKSEQAPVPKAGLPAAHLVF